MDVPPTFPQECSYRSYWCIPLEKKTSQFKMTCFFLEQFSTKPKQCHWCFTLKKHVNYAFLPATFKSCKPSECVILLHTTRKDTVKPCKTLRFWISLPGTSWCQTNWKILLVSNFLGCKRLMEKNLLKGHLFGQMFLSKPPFGWPFWCPTDLVSWESIPPEHQQSEECPQDIRPPSFKSSIGVKRYCFVPTNDLKIQQIQILYKKTNIIHLRVVSNKIMFFGLARNSNPLQFKKHFCRCGVLVSCHVFHDSFSMYNRPADIERPEQDIALIKIRAVTFMSSVQL